MTAPILFDWDGEAMVPQKRFHRLADKEFVVGETYPLVIQNARSQVSHNHYFASIHDAWLNLPEDIAEQYPSEEHLRKRALIEAGFYDEEIVDCADKEVALRVAPTIRKRDDFALIAVRGQFIVIRSAKSQSLKAMGKKDFQASKEAVLEVISAMVGVNPSELGHAA